MTIKVNGKRLNSEGNIRKHPNRNLYQGRVWVKKPNGKLERKTVYGKTRPIVKAKIKEALRIGQRSDSSALDNDPKQTLRHYLKSWHLSDPDLEPKSIESRRWSANTISKIIGDIPIGKLTSQNISYLYTELKKRGLKPNSVSQIHRQLNKALEDAASEDYQIIPFNPIGASPSLKKSKPTAEKRDLSEVILTKDEVKLLLSLQDKWTCLWGTLIGTGMRLGEGTGLRWSDVDLEKGLIKVRRTVGRVRNVLYVKEKPKTKSSRRDIKMPPDGGVIQSLRMCLESQVMANADVGVGKDGEFFDRKTRKKLERLYREKEVSDDLIFPSDLGKLLEPKLVYDNFKRTLKTIADSIDKEDLKTIKRWESLFKHTSPRDLRHTCGSLLHQHGRQAKDIQDLLGHENVTTTMTYYIQGNEETERETTGVMDQLLYS